VTHKYLLLRIIDPDTGDLLGIEHPHWGRQMWTRCYLRKPHACAVCGRHLLVGLTPVYRPITNKGNRMERICTPCVAYMVAQGAKVD